eukprot:TRINITY_DN31237_c0_g1_i1.p1 TRINITY_DN31237_c0_g1~~TRINITY_DN31237_c0_g1_i1.p1  ORF type:complete len:707 (+),score=148.56 TRINITY_DN31237_c0_g1_i1:110-2122(+)
MATTYEFASNHFKDVPPTTSLNWDHARKILQNIADAQNSPWNDDQIQRLYAVASANQGNISVDWLLEWIFQEESASEFMAFSDSQASSVAQAQHTAEWSQGQLAPPGPLSAVDGASGTLDPRRFVIPFPGGKMESPTAGGGEDGQPGATPKAGGAMPKTPGPVDAADPTKKGAQAQLAAAFAALKAGKQEQAGTEDAGKAEATGVAPKLLLKPPGIIPAKAGKIGLPLNFSAGGKGTPAGEAEPPSIKLTLPWDKSKEVIVGKLSDNEEERPSKVLRSGPAGKGFKVPSEFESLMVASGGDAFMASALSNAGSEDINVAFVKSVHPERGYSLLSINPMSDEFETIFLHGSVLSPAALQNEVAVAFKPQRNGKGQMQATGPVWCLKGSVEGDSILWGQYNGIIEKISAAGDAFVNCPEVSQQHGRHAYIYRKVAEDCELAVGDEIQFDIHMSHQGSPQVHAPVWKRHMSSTAAVAWNGTKPGPRPVASHDADAERDGIVVAYVKSVLPDQDYCLLSANPTDETCEKIYVHSSVCSPSVLANETAVAVRPRKNANGRIEASSPIFFLAGKLEGVEMLSKWLQYSGTVDKISPAGDALVSCPEVKARHTFAPFMYKKVVSMCGLKMGDRIQFNVHIDPKGQPLVQAPVWKMYVNDDEPAAGPNLPPGSFQCGW